MAGRIFRKTRIIFDLALFGSDLSIISLPISALLVVAGFGDYHLTIRLVIPAFRYPHGFRHTAMFFFPLLPCQPVRRPIMAVFVRVPIMEAITFMLVIFDAVPATPKPQRLCFRFSR